MSIRQIFVLTAIILGLGLLFGNWLYAQELRIDQIDGSDFKKIDVYCTVIDDSAVPVTDIKEEAWQLLEDGVPSKARMSITPFQFTNEGIAIVAIVGASGIMKGQPLESEKRALHALASQLQPLDKLAIIAYGDTSETIAGFETKDDERKTKIKKLKTFGNTVTFYDALSDAIKVLDKPTGLPRRKAIIIVSDGRDNGSTTTQPEILKELKKTNIPIYGIGHTLLGTRHLANLKNIAKVSGGEYFYARTDSRINVCFKKIFGQLKKGYLIHYKTKKIKGDEQYHQLTLKIKTPKKVLASSKKFKAKKDPWTVLEMVMYITIVVLVVALLVFVYLYIFVIPRPGYKRRCKKCKRLMRDEWEECQFCKYVAMYSKEALKHKR
jgi:VWFA-related protein